MAMDIDNRASKQRLIYDLRYTYGHFASNYDLWNYDSWNNDCTPVQYSQDGCNSTSSTSLTVRGAIVVDMRTCNIINIHNNAQLELLCAGDATADLTLFSLPYDSAEKLELGYRECRVVMYDTNTGKLTPFVNKHVVLKNITMPGIKGKLLLITSIVESKTEAKRREAKRREDRGKMFLTYSNGKVYMECFMYKLLTGNTFSLSDPENLSGKHLVAYDNRATPNEDMQYLIYTPLGSLYDLHIDINVAGGVSGTLIEIPYTQRKPLSATWDNISGIRLGEDIYLKKLRTT